MIKLAYEQGLNAGKDGIIKDSKNLTIDGRSTHNSGQDNAGSKGIQIEGIDEYLGKRTGFGFKRGK